ncbi:MAG: type II toxin-antitoxin system HigB family toxin [Caldilineaceae bacterium]|nr:type II toxin-antitoxin system HigB family toxin [Caldilineaceae bacterium]
MHVISLKALVEFWTIHPDSKDSLARWHRIVERSTFSDYASLHQTFPSADVVGQYTVFNIGGNKYRLIASIHFDRGKVYVRHVLTHQEYDLGKWKK